MSAKKQISLRGFVSDHKGDVSAMRLMSFTALLIAGLLALVEVFEWGSDESKTELVLYFLIAAFAPKAVQKFAENNSKTG